jgi:hypothetical protein
MPGRRRALKEPEREAIVAETTEEIERRLALAFSLLVEAHRLLQELAVASTPERQEQARAWVERYERAFGGSWGQS